MATDLLESVQADDPKLEERHHPQQADQDRCATTSRFVVGVFVVLSGYVAYSAYQIRDYFVDDAFIGFQYIRNLMSGDGFVFRAGEPAVEGVTNIGWLLFLAPFAAVTGPTSAAKLVGLVLVLVSLALTLYVGHRLATCGQPAGHPAGWALVPVVLLATNFDFLYFSLAGMETALLAALVMLMAAIAVHRPSSLALPALGAFAFLVHPEAAVVYPVYCLLLWRSEKITRRSMLRGNAVLCALIGVATVLRFAYFHDVVPNTFHSKPSGVFRVLVNGCNYLLGRNVNVPFPVSGWLALPVVLLGYLRLRRIAPSAAAIVGAITGTGLAFSIYSLPDWTGMGRYFAPYLPAALILIWVGLTDAIRRLLKPDLHPAAPALVGLGAVVLLALTGIFDGTIKMVKMETYPGYILAGKNLVEPSLWVRDHVEPDATIATRRIGALAYYSDKAIFDYIFGLPDREVARLVAETGRWFDSPTDPALGKLWPSRAPDYLLEDGETIDRIASCSGGSRDRFSIHGLQYRTVKSFPIGEDQHWVLAKRLEGGQR